MLLKHVKMETILMILQIGRFSMAQYYRTGTFRNYFITLLGFTKPPKMMIFEMLMTFFGPLDPSSVTNIQKLIRTLSMLLHTTCGDSDVGDLILVTIY